jgi:hypothetical protein
MLSADADESPLREAFWAYEETAGMNDASSIELPGRVMLSGGAEHDCSMRCGLDGGLEIVLPVSVPPGSLLVCHIPSLGVVEGTAGDATDSGCGLTLRATPAYRGRLAARIAWHQRRTAEHDEQRAAERVVPASATVRLGWPDGRAVEATLIDFSATGAALQSTDRPELGLPVVVGKRRAVVVRLLEEGFAVRFALPLRPQDVSVNTVL